MADKPISNAARKVAEKLIQTKYRNAGTYAVDKARGEGRSVVSAAQHAKSSEKNAMRPTSAAEINRAQTNAIQKNSVRVVPPTRTSGLSGESGVLGGQHAGGHSDVAGARGARGGGGFGGGPESFGGGGGLPRENM